MSKITAKGSAEAQETSFEGAERFSKEEQQCILRKIETLTAEGKTHEQATATAISICAPSKAQPKTTALGVGAGTFSATLGQVTEDKIKIQGGDYRWIDTHDGYFTVFDVPTMTEIPKGTKDAPKDVGRPELEHYVKVAQERYNTGHYAATCFKGHNSDIPITSPDFLGYLLPNRVGLHRMEDGPKWTVFADVKLNRSAFERARRGELPYHSPELPWERKRLSGLAFLDTVPPYFEFPLFTLGDELSELEYQARPVKFSDVVHDAAKFLEGEFTMHAETKPPAHCPLCEQKDAEIKLLKTLAADFEAAAKKAKMDAEAKCGPKGKMEAEAEAEAARKKKAKLEGKEEEEEEEKKKKSGPADQVPPKGSPLPLEPTSSTKEAKMSIPDDVIAMFAARDAKIATLEAKAKKHDEDDQKRTEDEARKSRVAKAKEQLVGLVLSSDIDNALAAFADDEKKLGVYVESLKKNAQRQPPTSIADWKGLGVEPSDPSLAKFAQQGPDVLEKAQQFAAQYREMKRRGWPLTSKEEDYVKFNLENPAA